MVIMELLLLVILGALALTALARRLGWPAPLLVTAVALLVSLIPGMPAVELEPELILTLVLPPLLYSAALDISYQGFKESRKQIERLGIFLVLVTALVVGAVVMLLYPSIGWAAALLLGAVVAPPDAVSATSIGKKLGLPRKVMTLISGESLINDAAALTLVTLFLEGVTNGVPSIPQGIAMFLVKVAVGVTVGLLLALAANWIRMHLKDAAISTAFNLILPFMAYLLAEQWHGSGVLAVVAAGLYMGYTAPRANYRTRLQETPIWASLDVLLEAFVFALIGLQFATILRELGNGELGIGASLAIATAVLITVIAIRPAFIFLTYWPGNWRITRALRARQRTRAEARNARAAAAGRPVHKLPHPPTFTWQELAVVSWTGMRGVVTLAAAVSIPVMSATGPFPGRELIILCAFVVTIGTLLIQGLTLPWLIRRLNVTDPHESEADARAEKRLMKETFKRAWQLFEEKGSDFLNNLPPDKAEHLRQKFKAMQEQEMARSAETVADSADARTVSLESAPKSTEREKQGAAMAAMRRELLELRRQVLIEERDAGNISDAVLRTVLKELDADELSMDTSWQSRMRS